MMFCKGKSVSWHQFNLMVKALFYAHFVQGRKSRQALFA